MTTIQTSLILFSSGLTMLVLSLIFFTKTLNLKTKIEAETKKTTQTSKPIPNSKHDVLSWKSGDRLLLNPTSDLYNKAFKDHETLAIVTLVKWDEENVSMRLYTSETPYLTTISDIKENIDDCQRKKLNNMDAFMKEHGIEQKNATKKSANNSSQSVSQKQKTFLNGKDIATMSETELNVYLKQALESEEYETAAKIREALEKYS